MSHSAGSAHLHLCEVRVLCVSDLLSRVAGRTNKTLMKETLGT